MHNNNNNNNGTRAVFFRSVSRTDGHSAEMTVFFSFMNGMKYLPRSDYRRRDLRCATLIEHVLILRKHIPAGGGLGSVRGSTDTRRMEKLRIPEVQTTARRKAS